MSHYLIQHPHHRRPYYTAISFLAADFRRWGYRVDTYPTSSLWIASFLKQERREDRYAPQRRARLLLLWAIEAVRRDHALHPEPPPPPEEPVDNIASVLRDFFIGLVRCSKEAYKYTAPYLSYANPPSTPLPIAFYTTLMSFYISRRVRPPQLSFFHERVDCLVIRCMWHRDRRREHVLDAMKFVVERGGEGERMAQLMWGGDQLRFYVRAMEMGGGAEGDAEEDVLPRYESEEEGAEGEAPPPYDEVVVRDPGPASRVGEIIT
ncbi:hypothetical protein BU23DRAFT_26530 [Bimuria novae-zelandiae CBS 107.79]|uniref:Uncharacterized protein n=1 Tax=Bimuria novae-zelandiae CBS 107.79 TaxID=1447943 RepID=A0A6A5UQZ6_9PLEO|nr:hypothetical protein BU23DRAFT_26530 [Bimuria novae-zelandiae CBS 107.79]